MRKAGIAEAKTHLSRLLEEVKGGVSVVITDRGRPVAKIVPVDVEGRRLSRRERLIARGVLLPGRGAVRSELLSSPRGGARAAGVLEALLEERRTGR